VAEHVDECLTRHDIDEGIDHIGISDIRDLIALGEALDVLLEGLVSPLLIVVEVLRVSRLSIHALEVIDKDGVEITLAADAAKLQLLKPGSSQA